MKDMCHIIDWWNSGVVISCLEEKVNSYEFICRIKQMQENNAFADIMAARDYDYAVIQSWYEKIMEATHNTMFSDDFRIYEYGSVAKCRITSDAEEYLPGKMYASVRFKAANELRRYSLPDFGDDMSKAYTYHTYDHSLKVGDNVQVPVHYGSKVGPALATIVEIYPDDPPEGTPETLEIFARSTADSNMEFQALKQRMDFPLAGPVLVIAEYENWKCQGKCVGARISQTNNACAAFRQLPEPYLRWWVDISGDLHCLGGHVRGLNKYTFRAVKGYINEYNDQLYDLVAELNKMSGIDLETWIKINSFTQRLGSLVCETECENAGPLAIHYGGSIAGRTLENLKSGL